MKKEEQAEQPKQEEPPKKTEQTSNEEPHPRKEEEKTEEEQAPAASHPKGLELDDDPPPNINGVGGFVRSVRSCSSSARFADVLRGGRRRRSLACPVSVSRRAWDSLPKRITGLPG